MPIVKRPKGYKITNVPAYHPTRRAAEKQLRAIKANQRRGRK